jgi:hypothetical protein
MEVDGIAAETKTATDDWTTTTNTVKQQQQLDHGHKLNKTNLKQNSISGVMMLAIHAFNQSWFEPLQLLHCCSVGYQPSTTWLTSPRRLILHANRRTQERKYNHTIWNCRCVWSKEKYRVQALITKGLIATVVKNKNGGPDSQQKDSMSQLQWRCLFLNEKLELNIIKTLMWWLLLSLHQRRDVLGLRATRWGCSQPGLKARYDTRPIWPKIGDAAPCRDHTEWSMKILELGLEPKESFHRYLSNTSKNASFWCRMREIWPILSRVACWIRTERGVQVDDDL